MKKSIFIIALISIIIFMIGSIVYAAEPTITLIGDSEKKAGETGEITVKVTSQDISAGVVSGKLSTTANLDEIKCTAKNNWNITYNSTTGEFNIYKAEGATEEEIFTIGYYVKDNATGTATITLSDLKVTTTDYETKELADIKKDITITSKTQEGTGNNENNVVTDNSINGSNIIVNNITNQNKVEVNNNTSVKDNTTSNNTIPKTGKEAIILPICLVIAILAIATYVGYRKYRDIK